MVRGGYNYFYMEIFAMDEYMYYDLRHFSDFLFDNFDGLL